jgi:uncharacterized membrane protein
MKIDKIDKLLLGLIAFYLVVSPVVWMTTGDFLHMFLGWNLILAVVPIILAKVILMKKHKLGIFIALSVFWLLFLPNSFYLITDLIYLSERIFIFQAHPYAEVIYLADYVNWMVLFHIISGVFISLFAGCYALSMMHEFGIGKIGKKWANIALVAVAFLSSVGIYIGRFFRYNSWNILSLWEVIKDLVEHIGFDMIFFILAYTVLHLLVYGLFWMTANRTPLKVQNE